MFLKFSWKEVKGRKFVAFEWSILNLCHWIMYEEPTPTSKQALIKIPSIHQIFNQNPFDKLLVEEEKWTKRSRIEREELTNLETTKKTLEIKETKSSLSEFLIAPEDT